MSRVGHEDKFHIVRTVSHLSSDVPAVKIKFPDKHKLREKELSLTQGSKVKGVHHGGEIKTVGPSNSCYIHNQKSREC